MTFWPSVPSTGLGSFGVPSDTMLRFTVYDRGKLADQIDLAGAYVFGQDGIPVRADLAAGAGQINCMKRVPGACGLAMVWQAGDSGKLLLPTTRLPERTEPYNLNVELARARLMRIVQKCEDWGLFDFPEANGLNEEFVFVRDTFISALKATDPAEASALADDALARGVTLGEKFALFHGDLFLARRKALPGGAGRTIFGVVADLRATADNFKERVRDTFDYISVPMPWKHTEPRENQHHYTQVDAWVNWATRNRRPVQAGPLLSFGPTQLPEWLYIWEHDYETLRDLVHEHVQRVVERYKNHVRVWNVVSGIHAVNSFNLTFEQLMELTRVSCLLVKKIAPRAQVMIELVMPWGEYYARNQRTIPPMLYADMAVQSGIKFDAFGIQLLMGAPVDGHYVRDLLQISTMLDEFLSFGKTCHITACQVPSANTPDPGDAWEGKVNPAKAGQWHSAWSPRLQAEWVQAFYRIAISKPFVESICWRDLADYQDHFLPHGGLCEADMTPKLAYRELRNFKVQLLTGGESPPPAQTEPEAPASEGSPVS